MLHKFSQLIWLGAGEANTPAGLFNQAEQVLLVESREEACRDLVKKTADLNQVRVQQSTISALAGEVNFYSYNLAEFSALMPATGLVEFFPGLKLVQQEKVTSVAIGEFITALKLSDRNNLLVLDLADISLVLLSKLASTRQLRSFSEIRLVAAATALYQQSGNRQQIENCLQQSGFYLTATDERDPDLPWLTFSANPLWDELESGKQQLQQAAAREAELSKELASANQQVQSLSQQQQQLAVENAKSRTQLQQAAEREAELTNQLASVKQQLAEKLKANELQQQQLQTEANSNKDLLAQLAAAKVATEKQQAEHQASLSGKDSALSALSLQYEQASTELASLHQQQQQLKAEAEQHKVALQTKTQEYTKLQTEQAAQLAKLKADLEQVSKHAAQRLEKIAALEKTNRQLQEQNQQLAKRQQLLEQEMLKAEAQIDLIKELILKP